MLDVLCKNKLYRKCKSAIRVTKVRIEIIKRKRNAMQKYLKNDVADLLKDGLDSNAYVRAGGLLLELNLTSCYELADKFCDHILEKLSVISKQRECPEECREAVSSLIVAASRFADLPELRELRSIFTERYGNSLDCYVNKEFVEKLKLTHPTTDATLELMQNIAREAGLLWDSKATEQKLYNPLPAFGHARSNVAGKFQASETPKNDKLSYISKYPKQIDSLNAIQEDIAVRNEQESGQKTTQNVLGEAFDDKKTFDYNPIPPYTKSGIGDNRSKDERLHLVASRNDHDDIAISDCGSSTASSAENDNSENGKKEKELKHLDENESDDEEQWLDRLLMYYSRNKTKRSPKQGVYSSRTKRGTNSDFRATRAALSLSDEQKIEEDTNKKGHARSASFQPELLKGRHVHPKLPDDYDDFLTHLAAIRKGGK
ncbi:hypothetical protein LIER_08114 [Lithospermum erythrorhizon]|uniref:IST1-like protein n=1 Tax=Lithospermum erythrorhizon TaxID=34254 RepID=A0AAV3PAN2_LITER